VRLSHAGSSRTIRSIAPRGHPLCGLVLCAGVSWRNGERVEASETTLPSRSPQVARRAQFRGKRLRELLGVKNDAPLLQRGVRNHFEHLDARIDAWHLAQPRPKADELERGELQAFAEVTVPPIRIIRPEDGVIAFRDEELDVPAVVEELGRILNPVRALEPLANVHPDLGSLLAVLPYYPPELQLSAPSRRPNEPVTAGIDVEAAHLLEDALREALRKADEASNEKRDRDNQ
jgi:hypothetical protein